MTHTISHGVYGESVLFTGPTAADVEFAIMEYQADNPAAVAGPIAYRVTREFGGYVWNVKINR